MKRALVPLLIGLLSCSQLTGHKSKDKTTEILILLGLLQPASYSKLYFINSLITSSPQNKALIWEASLSDVTPGKKKLVLVHGWHFNDRSPAPSLTGDELKDRVLSQNWSAFFATTDYATIVNTKSYDVYALDYLTARGVEENGAMFRQKMDALFSSSADNGTVVIYAHSMGGLVTRFALYS